MLSSHSTSSIHKRQQQHRRQQSLAVPILAPPLPAHPRRTQPARSTHRRGLSLDQSMPMLDAAAGFRALHSQEQRQDQELTPTRTPMDATNPGHPTDSQHFSQETQQQSIAQPGFSAHDFQSHLQQQLHGHVPTHAAAPTPAQPSRMQALEQLQHHVQWYNQNFGIAPEPNVSFNTNSAAPPAAGPPMVQHAVPALSQSQSRTVPNTPLQYTQGWSSPPVGIVKARKQSFQLDVAPMPVTVNGGRAVQMTSSPATYAEQMNSFAQDSYTLSSDRGYASSTYSSSVADPLSPRMSHAHSAMPTLFEEPMQQMSMSQDTMLLHASAGTSDEFSSPNFMMSTGSITAVSPAAALLESLGPNVNASIIDTGIPVDDIDQYISEPHPVTKLFYCLWKDDGVQCDKWHKRKENARSHVQGHMGDRQFLCNDCGKTFVRQHDMKRHAAIHNPERPHRCPCGSRFARHDALTRHRQRGMCKGALPGFERSEEDKPKRGRPKKKDGRPDMASRTSKAQRARRMDRSDSEEAAYASPRSNASDNSLPMTPPHTSDFNTGAFSSVGGSGPTAWNDTPPTSPLAGHSASQNKLHPGHSISPAMLSQPSMHSSPAMAPQHLLHTPALSAPSPTSSFHGVSSPLASYSHRGLMDSGFDFGGGASTGPLGTQPDVTGSSSAPDFFSDAFSASDEASSPLREAELELHVAHDSVTFDGDDVGNAHFLMHKGDFAGSRGPIDFAESLFGADDCEPGERDLSLFSALDHFVAMH